MAKKSEAFPSRFLHAEDMNGKPMTVTIASADFETLKYDGKEQRKMVLTFRETKKVLTVNVTNWDMIVLITGQEDSSNWPGHKIELYPSTTQVGAKMVACIRIRSPEQPELRPANVRPIPPDAPDDMDDELPAAFQRKKARRA
jgi:hypothetical protein